MGMTAIERQTLAQLASDCHRPYMPFSVYKSRLETLVNWVERFAAVAPPPDATPPDAAATAQCETCGRTVTFTGQHGVTRVVVRSCFACTPAR
jgi:hypothetical protein